MIGTSFFSDGESIYVNKALEEVEPHPHSHDFLDFSLVNYKDFSDITHHFLFCSLFPEEGGNKSDIRLRGRDSRGNKELYKKVYCEMLLTYVI